MDTVRSALLVVICVLAIAGTALFYGSPPAALTAEERAIAGRWNTTNVDLELGEGGRYALVVGTHGGLECGKWRVVDGTLQMRAKKIPGVKTTLLLTQPGFRAGKFTHQGAAIDFEMQSALPGERSRPESWTMQPASGSLLDGCR